MGDITSEDYIGRRELGAATYRFLLAERWAPGPMIGFLGMNPSDASLERTDPTWLRGDGFARRWGFAGQAWANPVPLRSPDPDAAITSLRAHANGQADLTDLFDENRDILARYATRAAAWVVGWGDKGAAMNDVVRCHAKTLEALRAGGARCFLAFGLTNSGNPKHILARGKARIPDDAQPHYFDPISRRLGARVDFSALLDPEIGRA